VLGTKPGGWYCTKWVFQCTSYSQELAIGELAHLQSQKTGFGTNIKYLRLEDGFH